MQEIEKAIHTDLEIFSALESWNLRILTMIECCLMKSSLKITLTATGAQEYLIM